MDRDIDERYICVSYICTYVTLPSHHAGLHACNICVLFFGASLKVFETKSFVLRMRCVYRYGFSILPLAVAAPMLASTRPLIMSLEVEQRWSKVLDPDRTVSLVHVSQAHTTLFVGDHSGLSIV